MDTLKPKLILLVDDEADIRDLIREELEDAGYSVIQAENGRQAFELLRNNSVDAVVSDVRMAGGDGIELLERMKSSLQDAPPLIYITGYAEISREEAEAKGVAGMLKKPFDPIAVVEELKRVMGPKA